MNLKITIAALVLVFGQIATANDSFRIPMEYAKMKVPAFQFYLLNTNRPNKFESTGYDDNLSIKNVHDKMLYINNYVNKHVTPRADPAGRDEWQEFDFDFIFQKNLKENKEILFSHGDYFGDCEDYALTKRRLLMLYGIRTGNLLIAVVQTPLGEYHAVLVVRTVEGDFILDNLNNKILRWDQTQYRVYKVQSTESPVDWWLF